MAKLLANTWLYRQPKKKYKKKKPKIAKRKSKNTRLIKFAEQLEKNLPKSEVWFRNQYVLKSEDLVNIPFGPYIPDIINKKYYYVIEIDGSIHNNLEVKQRDQLKDWFYRNRGYKVFRVIAYSKQSFTDFLLEYNRYMVQFNNLV